MAEETEQSSMLEEEFQPILSQLEKEMDDLFSYRDLFFEQNPLEMAKDKSRLVLEKMNQVIEKFDDIDENQLPVSCRARYLYIKGRTYNVSDKYDARASQCLSKAIKLQPRLVHAWNELGESYWKNMNIKNAKNSFEGALRIERNKVSLRCLSIILRQDVGNAATYKQNIEQSVELAKEAVSLDYKDGVSWYLLGNAYMCHYFVVSPQPETMNACMSAYVKASAEPVSAALPDLHYNRGMVLKFMEQYTDAIEYFEKACKLDPSWNVAAEEMAKLHRFLTQVNDLVRTKGKIKIKKIQQMVQSIDPKMLGPYGVPNTFHTFGKRKDVVVDPLKLDSLVEGSNRGKIVLGRVVGSIHSENVVPFTFAIVDESMCCVCVSVYNWANGRGVIIGDSVAVPEPYVLRHNFTMSNTEFNFSSIRVNNPMMMLVNGKSVGVDQFAATIVTSSFEIPH